TGGALRAASEVIADSGAVLVLSGDVPLISATMIEELLAIHSRNYAQATVLTTILPDPTGYGRVVRDRDGHVIKVVETKEAGDATDEQLSINEINAGIYVFDSAALNEALERIDNDNAQGEYYAPDVLPRIREAGGRVVAHIADDPNVILGVNDRIDLAMVEAEARRLICERHMEAGVTIVDPLTTWIEVEVKIAADTRIEPGCSLMGATRVHTGSVVGPHTTLIDSEIGAQVTVPHSYLIEARVGDRASVGPFAYLRPGAQLEDGSKAGTFVEIKNSVIGEGAKVPHLSYIGDADIGPGTNLGAATITANYDGRAKHRTRIGKEVRTGVDTTLVAPVEVGDGAYTGAGSVITSDVPEGSLALSRPEQVTVDGYAERKAAESAGSREEKSQ
ncbi:MAG: bifunctional UDP-N-acetylglucosamine diphosphorylase/glucosamine-1-phosphate N-acetyltransferase GlmU, partial [Solirubrobacterales bacterium]